MSPVLLLPAPCQRHLLTKTGRRPEHKGAIVETLQGGREEIFTGISGALFKMNTWVNKSGGERCCYWVCVRISAIEDARNGLIVDGVSG